MDLHTQDFRYLAKEPVGGEATRGSCCENEITLDCVAGNSKERESETVSETLVGRVLRVELLEQRYLSRN